MRPWQHVVKRGADILCSLVGLIILSPVFILFAVMLKIQRNGPVFFSQKRIGYKGKPFTIYKFRTLSTVVEDEGPQLIAQSDSVQSTPFEKFLRDHHLDELPQLWNVLIGNMSLVGPRPERKYYIDQIMEHTHDYLLIYQMKPGLTSEATIYNGYTDTMEKMLKRLDMDIRYLENRTLRTDLSIIIQTIGCLFQSSEGQTDNKNKPHHPTPSPAEATTTTNNEQF
ncbi:MAG: sugar transferase [Prevotella sp.]|nr:sugar transferase [Prevotella sp.]